MWVLGIDPLLSTFLKFNVYEYFCLHVCVLCAYTALNYVHAVPEEDIRSLRTRVGIIVHHPVEARNLTLSSERAAHLHHTAVFPVYLSEPHSLLS